MDPARLIAEAHMYLIENTDEQAMYFVFHMEQEITSHMKLLPPLCMVMLSLAMLVP